MNRPLRVSVVPCLFAEPRLSKYRDISEWIRLTSWISNEKRVFESVLARVLTSLEFCTLEKINSR